MDLKIFTENIDPKALGQIYDLVKLPAFENCKIRIMPDVHAGMGCVIGFTANLGDKVIPSIVGVDIGCGMLTINLGKVDLDLEKLDQIINKYVPSGKSTHESRTLNGPQLMNLICYRDLEYMDRIQKSIGTLGGGNHFCEIDIDDEGNKYLIIHSGSRNLGKQVANHYQELAIRLMQGENDLLERQSKLIADYSKAGKKKEIQKAIGELRRTFQPKKLGVPKELCYLEGKYRHHYLNDMGICQQYAIENRRAMADIILDKMGLREVSSFETIHNYIDLESNVVRKGAISAKDGEMLLIPINMRDGCILGKGKGNEEWNQSAPHGAGRLMSRSQAKATLDLEAFKDTMSDVYSTSVSLATLDEAPMAYKPIEEILDNIGDSVEILKILKPIYNFKASE